MKDSVLKKKSHAFALRVIRLYKFLCEQRKEYVLSKQILRCGTSIGANIAEGAYAQSESDFISKLAIAQKEANETLYWLELLNDSGYIEQEAFESMASDQAEIQKLLTASIKTLRAHLRN